MKKVIAALLGMGMVMLAFTPSGFTADKVLMMSTTTSTQASGLLEVLLPELKKDTGIEVKVIAKGTGAAIRDGQDGNVDVIFVHAKAREEKFVADGYGTKRYAVMHNDFIILGPKSDPAGIRGVKDSAQALKKIADSKSAFISRGDDSGTHTKEQALWQATGLETETVSKTITKKGKQRVISFTHPKGLGEWYMSIGQGMGKTLTFANEKQAYTMTDRGTYIKYKLGRKEGLELEILCEGDAQLFNPYGVIPVNPEKFSHAKYDMAKEFAEWLVSQKGQSLIANYKLLGQQLFYPDALPNAK
ncbi:tungsten ABC transporter substrate-binding prote in [Desulfonema ishimotonii]|uniref:Tungsten ABC transporter substrate-binding prote in n=1 Tax=Desulfonema ishimotonii TaxID=45657 RepID=A0A401FQ26_9BACT|nr:substrate-binding domain-containing protein [Desulfonema ishimotonii]GBC59098.1 tungsten ABC transporter substrate-binding prote in [Desulfonema ishimotonii]